MSPDNLRQVKGFHERLFSAWKHWELKHRQRLTQTTLGEMVGRMRGTDAIGQSTVNGWLRVVIPHPEEQWIIARCLEVDPCWLTYGMGEGPGNTIAMMAKPATRR